MAESALRAYSTLCYTLLSGYDQIGPNGPPHPQATLWSILVDTQQKTEIELI